MHPPFLETHAVDIVGGGLAPTVSRPLRGAPVRFAIAGMGGYAKHVADHLLSSSSAPTPFAELVAVCDPTPHAHRNRHEFLAGHGVEVYNAFEALLDRSDIDAIWLPLPIELHRPFTEQALAAGKHVVCEKPAAGTVADVQAMIHARNSAGMLCAVGFQDLYRPTIRNLKRQLMSGRLGSPVQVSVFGCWPRDTWYFARNAWAGRLRRGDTWILDSIANNAMAHFINLALFLLGSTEEASTPLAKVEAELYRAFDIENFDTCTLRVTTTTGVECLIAMTHACQASVEPSITITTDRTRICVQHPDVITVGLNGSAVRITDDVPASPSTAAEGVAARIRGDNTAPIATLESALVHTQLINAVAEASPVRLVPTEAIDFTGNRRSIHGIEAALQQCAATGRLLHETRAFPWTAEPGESDIGSDHQFAGRIPRL